MWTPWGEADSVTEVADGITMVGTPSHGGYKLSAKKMAEVRRLFPSLKLYAGENWFEEDSDWSFVAVVFPQYFDYRNLMAAIKEVCRRGGE